MAKLTVAGIPIHPLINDLPATLIPTTAAADAIALLTGDRAWSRTAYHTLVLSLISGVAAGMAGAVDYAGVPARGEQKTTANIHALLNAGLVAVTFLNFMLRRGRAERPGMISRLLSFASVPLLFYSGLEGAILAYRYHMAEAPHAEGPAVEELEPTERDW